MRSFVTQSPEVAQTYLMQGIASPLTLYPLRQTAGFPKSVNTDSLPMYNIPLILKATDQLISKVTLAAMKDVVILRKITGILKHENKKLQKCANRPMS